MGAYVMQGSPIGDETQFKCFFFSFVFLVSCCFFFMFTHSEAHCLILVLHQKSLEVHGAMAKMVSPPFYQ